MVGNRSALTAVCSSRCMAAILLQPGVVTHPKVPAVSRMTAYATRAAADARLRAIVRAIQAPRLATRRLRSTQLCAPTRCKEP